MSATVARSMGEDEMFRLFREFMAGKRQGPDKFEPLKNHPNHRGVMDADFVRPAPTDYPAMRYHSVLKPRIVQTKEEDLALGSDWQNTPVVQAIDWKAKANEVFTTSGFQVRTHHVEFLRQSGILGIETMREAADFLNRLNQQEQEQFFMEAESQQAPEAKEEKAVKGKKQKAA